MNQDKNKYSGAERLKSLRKSMGLTQEEMAEELGVSESLYKGAERSKISISRRTAEAIESRFGISADYFYYGTLRDGEDVWTQLIECDDRDKLRIFLRLLNYFSVQGCFRLKEDDIKGIVDFLFKDKE